MVHQTDGENPLVGVELVHGTPGFFCKFKYALNRENQLSDVVLLEFDVGQAADDATVGIAVELELVGNLQLTFWPFVGQGRKLYLLYIQQFKLDLDGLLIILSHIMSVFLFFSFNLPRRNRNSGVRNRKSNRSESHNDDNRSG